MVVRELVLIGKELPGAARVMNAAGLVRHHAIDVATKAVDRVPLLLGVERETLEVQLFDVLERRSRPVRMAIIEFASIGDRGKLGPGPLAGGVDNARDVSAPQRIRRAHREDLEVARRRPGAGLRLDQACASSRGKIVGP